jgi:hypothetical protein
MAIARIDDYLYLWAIPSGRREGGVQLMRVLETEIEQLDAYEYFTGIRGRRARWSADMEEATTIVEKPTGEISVIWNEYLDRWIMTYLNESTHAIELREAAEPWGPWSEPFRVAPASRFPALYGAYMHPTYTEDSGRVVYFNMSMWGPYNVFTMKMEFEKKE